MNINHLDKQFCTGCASCANICPVGAIEMRENDEGFLYPHINNKCTNCGLCSSHCPALNNTLPKIVNKESYAVMATDDLRKKGSSGGVFPIIAEHVINNNGVVYGAAFEDDFKKVTLQRATTVEELNKLYKSKYVQSETLTIFKSVKADLEKGKMVLFSACPCQVDGLKTFLGKDYNNLYLIDILCHGAPSPLAYRKFLEMINQGKKKITHVDFRDKSRGWGTNITVKFEDGTEHTEPGNGEYMRSFLSGFSMREGCFSCKYANPKRVGDITLGDFWGVWDIDKELNDGKGTSIVLCNNKKGKKLLDLINRE